MINFKTLEKQIEEDIDQYCRQIYDNDHRKHLGASQMGEKCLRKLFYIFRWVKKPNFNGRMLRLFNVGHEAEPRFVKYLRGIGFEVEEFQNPETKQQWRISGVKGHYGGSLDGKCKAPDRYKLPEDLVFLNEFKTNGTGSGYTQVRDKPKLSDSKPKHWAQMCQYGYKYQLKYGLYLIENKNDSDITPKIVELDWNYGAELEAKAERIILSQTPPNRISDNPAYTECKLCEFLDICHGKAKVEKNCRSCVYAEPIENSAWKCNRWNNIIPEDFILKACDNHTSINGEWI